MLVPSGNAKTRSNGPGIKLGFEIVNVTAFAVLTWYGTLRSVDVMMGFTYTMALSVNLASSAPPALRSLSVRING